MSMSELARQCDTQHQTVHVWEQGRAKPVDEALLLVAEALGTSVSYLYGETDAPGPAPNWHRPGTPSSSAQATAQEASLLLRDALAKVEDLGRG